LQTHEILAASDARINGDRPWDVQVHNHDFCPRVIAKGVIAKGVVAKGVIAKGVVAKGSLAQYRAVLRSDFYLEKV